MKSFVVVHNIPSPYRLHLFSVLNERLRAYDVTFHVHFMAQLHEDRQHWALDGQELAFSHSFWSDIGPTIRGMKWHLNPGLVKTLQEHPSDYLLVGGLWDSLTNMLVSVLADRTIGIAWLEGNRKTAGRITGVSQQFKRLLLNRYQYVAVPGAEGHAYVQLILSEGNSTPRSVYLPNIVDERLFTSKSQTPSVIRHEVRSRLGIGSEDRVAVWPARLVPAKGTVEFLSLLTPQDLCGWKVLLLGEGPLKHQLESIVAARGLKEHVILRTHVTYNQMPEIFAASDLFLLPSIMDQNPLSVVEAMHVGLPLLVSNRIGNYPEACRENINGWGLDPYRKDSVLAAVRSAFSASPDKLQEMGRHSQLMAAEFWGSVNAVDRFIEGVLDEAN